MVRKRRYCDSKMREADEVSKRTSLIPARVTEKEKGLAL